MAITRILYKSLLKQARALAKPTPASKLLIYKDEYSRDYSNTLLTAGEHQYLEALNSYLGGPEAAMLALHKTDSTDLSEIIKANFRSSPPTSASLDAGFLALKQLTNKVKWGNQLEMEKRSPLTTPIKATMESPEVKPGTFLVAHPLLNGFFERTVISIIKTSEKEGVYGAIVNRPTHFSSPLPLSEIFQKPLPPNFKECFESKMVDLGGPVIDNLQMMLHNNPSVGGISIGDGMFYAGGDVSKAIEAVKLKAGERAKRASPDEEENTRDESREMATDISGYIHYKLTLYHSILLTFC